SVSSDFASSSARGGSPVAQHGDPQSGYVRAELPGIGREDIKVAVVDDTLTVEAARKLKGDDKEESFLVSRSVSLPDSVRSEGITATLENGVLTVTLPKREEAKPRKINVSVN